MTGPENERLAVLESQYNALQNDVSEIKSDVKSLVATQNSLALALAVKESAEQKDRIARSNTGVWVRTFLPMAVAFFAAVISLIAVLTR